MGDDFGEERVGFVCVRGLEKDKFLIVWGLLWSLGGGGGLEGGFLSTDWGLFFFEFWGNLILKIMATLCLFFWRVE